MQSELDPDLETDFPETRKRVLVLAEVANPEWVSVPLIGWSLSQALAQVADVHLVTQIRNRDACIRAGLVEGKDFTAIDTEAMARPIWKIADKLGLGKKGGWSLLIALQALSYPLFERKVWRKFGKEIKRGQFDIVHRITPVSPTIDSPIARKCRQAGAPFILGPINGALAWPKGFPDHQRRERDRAKALRGIARWVQGTPSMVTNAAFVLCGARSVQAELPDDIRSIIIPENGIEPDRFTRRAVQPGTLPLRGCFIGRLSAIKGIDLLLKAAAPLLRDGRLHLDILGDGPERDFLESLTDELGIGDGVTFHGWIAHEQVQDIAVKSHLLTFPSLRDFGGGAVLEGMALGLVPIVLDYGGPAELVDDTTGFRIPMGTQDQVIDGLNSVLTALADDPSDLPRLSENALEKIRTTFLWSAKAKQIAAIYDTVLNYDEEPLDD